MKACHGVTTEFASTLPPSWDRNTTTVKVWWKLQASNVLFPIALIGRVHFQIQLYCLCFRVKENSFRQLCLRVLCLHPLCGLRLQISQAGSWFERDFLKFTLMTLTFFTSILTITVSSDWAGLFRVLSNLLWLGRVLLGSYLVFSNWVGSCLIQSSLTEQGLVLSSLL